MHKRTDLYYITDNAKKKDIAKQFHRSIIALQTNKRECLQGRVQFPTGGRVRARKLNRCDSGTDSIVWMEEDV